MEKYIAIGIRLTIVCGFLMAARYCVDMGVAFWVGIALIECGLIGIAWCGINATMED